MVIVGLAECIQVLDHVCYYPGELVGGDRGSTGLGWEVSVEFRHFFLEYMVYVNN